MLITISQQLSHAEGLPRKDPPPPTPPRRHAPPTSSVRFAELYSMMDRNPASLYDPFTGEIDPAMWAIRGLVIFLRESMPLYGMEGPYFRLHLACMHLVEMLYNGSEVSLWHMRKVLATARDAFKDHDGLDGEIDICDIVDVLRKSIDIKSISAYWHGTTAAKAKAKAQEEEDNERLHVGEAGVAVGR